jgi:hypothetical protein
VQVLLALLLFLLLLLHVQLYNAVPFLVVLPLALALLAAAFIFFGSRLADAMRGAADRFNLRNAPFHEEHAQPAGPTGPTGTSRKAISVHTQAFKAKARISRSMLQGLQEAKTHISMEAAAAAGPGAAMGESYEGYVRPFLAGDQGRIFGTDTGTSTGTDANADADKGVAMSDSDSFNDSFSEASDSSDEGEGEGTHTTGWVHVREYKYDSEQLALHQHDVEDLHGFDDTDLCLDPAARGALDDSSTAGGSDDEGTEDSSLPNSFQSMSVSTKSHTPKSTSQDLDALRRGARQARLKKLADSSSPSALRPIPVPVPLITVRGQFKGAPRNVREAFGSPKAASREFSKPTWNATPVNAEEQPQQTTKPVAVTAGGAAAAVAAARDTDPPAPAAVPLLSLDSYSSDISDAQSEYGSSDYGLNSSTSRTAVAPSPTAPAVVSALLTDNPPLQVADEWQSWDLSPVSPRTYLARFSPSAKSSGSKS